MYSDCEKKPWMSVVLAEDQAERLLTCVMKTESDESGHAFGKVVRGKHSAAMAALTSLHSVPLVLASVQFALFSGGSKGMIIIAFILLAAALLCMLYAAVRCRGLSLVRRSNGFEVMWGLLRRKHAFVPDEAVSGIHVSCSPASVLFRSGTVSLICRGGREIRCMCSVAPGEAFHTALKLIGAADSPKTSLSDVSSLCRRYVAMLTAFSTILLLVWFYAWSGDAERVRTVFCLFGVILSWAVLHCAVGLACAGSFGLEVTPSAVFAGGMGIFSAKYSFIRRGQLSGFRISSTFLEQSRNLCSVIPFVTGYRASACCRCIPYGETNGLLGRFC